MVRVAVKPELLRWARERAGVTLEDLEKKKKFKKLPEWESDRDIFPTLNQLEEFAKAVHVPLGYLFLDEPPEERLPIADFRTIGNTQRAKPSPNLIDTIYAMQRRQDWMHDYMIECQASPLPFAGSAGLGDDPGTIGMEMRNMMGLNRGWAGKVSTWQDAVARLRRDIEKLGVMAVINGVVGNSNHRSLNVKEFRGFALTDQYAPLIFVNGKDSKAAQMFTLAHELAHIWLGESGLSGFEKMIPAGTEIEEWCNRAAAEFLLPSQELIQRWNQVKGQESPYRILAREYKVSPIVAARRALDLQLIERATYFEFYEDYISQPIKSKRSSSGGDFYRTQNVRVGRLFATRVIGAAMEGKIGFKRAYELTGLWGGSFRGYAKELGIQLN
ncbi:MAG: ImmA/IrrE family metallo-endopeptidase [Rhodothermaceae bacterium]|nr:ImmA/IrrE family metallo-endopeptidase [Rhodothermaceae bacterium]MXZ58859.1 ImmA/IrrE family metallo-endopeptidase [Rhodothermaceae bacterium]MYB89983.1 ImmA/IrrE family metallo-endopeptidase [Rhodothermaceae bacterium]MYD68453.1 ImmA/IrrE family metallo-endopeptidase [Rhodothermaceae bacterium]MYG43724.1 ImmA/IrrE family metallo-endopeptidase [Rhodothermaceae bacterium]